MAFKQLTIMINHNQSWLWLISIIMINRDNSGLFFCVNQPVYQLCIRANIVNGRLINALKCNNILKNFAIFLYIQTYRSWRVCPWQRRWRSSCSSSVRSTRWWKRRRRRSHRYQTWVQVKFSNRWKSFNFWFHRMALRVFFVLFFSLFEYKTQLVWQSLLGSWKASNVTSEWTSQSGGVVSVDLCGAVAQMLLVLSCCSTKTLWLWSHCRPKSNPGHFHVRSDIRNVCNVFPAPWTWSGPRSALTKAVVQWRSHWDYDMNHQAKKFINQILAK